MKVDELKQLVKQLTDVDLQSNSVQFYKPVFNSLIAFVNSIIEIMDEIGISIKESSLEVPKATDQLEKVTHETEEAATEMLNIVDSITICVEKINQNIKEAKKGLRLFTDKNGNIIDFKNEKKQLKEAQENIDEIQNLNFNILNSLQFQDITSQQIKSANYILKSVRIHLNSLIGNLDNVSLDKANEEHKDFDTQATIQDSDLRQSAADQIINDITRTTKKNG